MDNHISAELTTANKTDILQQLTEIQALLPFLIILTTLLLAPLAIFAAGPAKGQRTMSAGDCSVATAGTRVTLKSPAFTFTLDTADGLRAVSWENRLTGRTFNRGASKANSYQSDHAVAVIAAASGLRTKTGGRSQS